MSSVDESTLPADDGVHEEPSRPRRISVIDVAARARVSPSTVSRHLNGQRVRRASAVQTAIEELRFVPSQSARALKLGQSLAVAVAGPETTNPYFAAVVSGAESVAREQGYNVLLVNIPVDSTPETEEAILLGLAGRVDGIILTPLSETDHVTSRLASAGIPVVLLEGDSDTHEENDTVLVDHYRSGYDATEHLIRAGHKRIAAIYPRLETTGGRLKREGIHAAMAAHGMDLPSEYEAGGVYGREAGYRAMVQLLTRGVRPTAVICCANLVTIGALRAVRDLSIRVPDELSIVAIDDFETFDLLSPAITVIDRPTYDQGVLAMRLLLERIGRSEPVNPRYFVMKTKLVTRDSVAAPATS